MNNKKIEKFVGIVNDVNDKTPYCFDCENIDNRKNCIICINEDKLPKNIKIKDSKEYLIEIIEDNNGDVEIYFDNEEDDNVFGDDEGEDKIYYEYLTDPYDGNCVKYKLINFDLYDNSKNEKISSQKCKEEIIKYCLQNKDKIVNEFVPVLDETQFLETQKIKNWKRKCKHIQDDILNKYNGKKYIERSFDCEPFEDSLRGYVESDLSDTTILCLYVVGE